ncbi:MAG TPA: hypothetical protein VGK87_03100 [Anaerolineae bacterium]|jgi:hypothetical protein
MSDQQSQSIWKRIPGIVLNRLNGRHENDIEPVEIAPDPRVQVLFQTEYNLDEIGTTSYRALIAQAMQYRTKVESLVSRYPNSHSRETLLPIVRLFEECFGSIYRLAKTGNHPVASPDTGESVLLHTDSQRDNRTRPESAAVLTGNSSEAIAAKSEITASSSHDNPLGMSIDQQFEDTFAVFGVAYSLLLLLDGKEVSNQQAQRLHDLLSDQSTALSMQFRSDNTSSGQPVPNS